MKHEDIKVGQWVIYRPHPDAEPEDGTVERVNDRFVFVRYWQDNAVKGTYASDLEPGGSLA